MNIERLFIFGAVIDFRNFRHVSRKSVKTVRMLCDITRSMGKKVKPAPILAATVMLVACCGGKLYGIAPFGTPMYCALSSGFFIGFLSPIYILCEFLFSFDVWRLYTSCAVVFIVAVRWILALRFKRLRTRTAVALFSLFAILCEAGLGVLFMPVPDAAISCAVGIVFFYFAVFAADCAKCGCAVRPGITEAAALCAVTLVFGSACGRAQYGGFAIGLAPAMLFILLVDTAGTKALITLGTALGLGLGQSAGMPMIPAVAAAVFGVAAFDKFPRPVYALTALGMFAASSILFYTEPVTVGWNSLMMFAGAAMFCIIPRRTVRALRDYFDFDGSSRLAVRHYINRTRSDAGNRMLAVASVFDETARLMSALSSPPPDYEAIGEALSDKVCPYCKKRGKCDEASRRAAFTALAERATFGRAILSDIPEFFTSDCARVAEVINESNAVTDAAREREREKDSEDKAKQIVTERLSAVKDVLEELGTSQAVPVGFNAETERKLVFELNNAGVECAEAFCSAEGVTAVVRTGSASAEKIRKAASACLKRDCELVTLEKTQAAGWSVASLKKRPAYEAVYARAGLAKDGINGDSYTFKRIGDKFLAALLDGMGSGETASASSGTAVELIECFYRAGFDSKSALTGVNRFLKLPAAENYSAADVAVCDLDSAECDIIKIGAPPCYIKTADTVLKIEGASLPIGVLDEMHPYVTVKRLYPGQMLILVTDGVSDCFTGDGLPEFINGLSAFNPESAVKAIVSRALALSGGTPKDDMTAVAFRLYEKRKRFRLC